MADDSVARKQPKKIQPKLKIKSQAAKKKETRDALPVRGAWGDLGRYVNAHKVNETGAYGFFLRSYYDVEIRDKYHLLCDNVLAARTKVYQNWMKLLRKEELSNRVHFIRYEELQAQPFAEFQKMAGRLGITCNVTDPEKFDRVTARVKMGNEDKAISFKGKHPRKEFCSTVDSDSLYQDILSKIDRTFDSEVLGYTYPDTRQEYCEGVK
jgi:hypothetical protein